MTHFYDKTPILDAGIAKSMMRHFLTQVKSHRGLTTFIEHRGVNGRWLKPDQPYNIRMSKFLKIMENMALYQTDEEFLDDWKAAGNFFLRLVRNYHLIHFL